MKKYFLTGLVILLPLMLTIAVLGFLINLLTKPFMGIVSKILAHFQIVEHGFLFLTTEDVIRLISQILVLVLLFVITIALGIVARWFFVGALVKLGDKILRRIPVVNTVYKTTQDVIKTLFGSEKGSFKQVVLVPFPKKGVYAMGLVTSESPKSCSEKVGENLISVLIPTTPNPTTGFLLMYPEQELIYIDIKPEEAIKYIVSCGLIAPQSEGS